MVDVRYAAVLTMVWLVSDGENPRVDGTVDGPAEDNDDDGVVTVGLRGIEVKVAVLMADVTTT